MSQERLSTDVTDAVLLPVWKIVKDIDFSFAESFFMNVVYMSPFEPKAITFEGSNYNQLVYQSLHRYYLSRIDGLTYRVSCHWII